jgi:hypothetical protein
VCVCVCVCVCACVCQCVCVCVCVCVWFIPEHDDDKVKAIPPDPKVRTCSIGADPYQKLNEKKHSEKTFENL